MTTAPVDLASDAKGHWRWRNPQTSSGWSLLAFKTPEDAAADHRIHADSAQDATGRRVLPKDYLRRLVSAIALQCTACDDVYFGGVFWHPRDADGANWGVGIMSGDGDRTGCAACVQAGKDELRRLYAIVDEG